MPVPFLCLYFSSHQNKGIEEQDGFHENFHQVKEIVVTPDMRKFMDNYTFQLP